MKITKKLLALALAMVFILAACGGADNSSNTGTDNSQEGSTRASGLINVVSREDGSGTRGAFVEIVGVVDENDEDATSLEADIQNGTDKVIAAVAGDDRAIGYISLGSLNDDVKAIKVDGVEATEENVLSGDYKIQRPLLFVYKFILTAKTSEFDKVKGLDMGADDYVTKPFGVMELISRIKALLRRIPVKNDDDNILQHEDLQVNLETREVQLSGHAIDLTYKEFELLVYLLENKEKVLSREKIMTRVWGYDYMGETRTVDVHIRTLRSKLSDKSDLIKTVRNIGYKLGE